MFVHEVRDGNASYSTSGRQTLQIRQFYLCFPETHWVTRLYWILIWHTTAFLFCAVVSDPKYDHICNIKMLFVLVHVISIRCDVGYARSSCHLRDGEMYGSQECNWYFILHVETSDAIHTWWHTAESHRIKLTLAVLLINPRNVSVYCTSVLHKQS
jgi:hypothetical protein